MKIALQEERIARGWTQAYVAEHCGVSYQTVCDWENNRRKPSYTVLVKLEDLFATSHRELFKEANDEKQPEELTAVQHLAEHEAEMPQSKQS